MSKRVKLAVGAVFVVVVGIIVYSTMNLSHFECEVCVEFKGRTSCRTAAGSTREEAVRTATDNACADIASGMTDSIACGHTTPTSVRWLRQ
ncbi:MAG: hypothetical protein LAO21_17210 [Acidobacteriia bacterium]|nr:hypothetical protein [Terriglobia bacterium]